MIAAVLFDLFDTLITERGQVALPSTVAQRLGVEEEAFLAAWKRRRTARYTGAFVEFADVLRSICRELHCAIDEQVIMQISAQRLALKAAPFTHIREDIVRMLVQLHERRIATGVVSNASSDEVAAWLSSPLAELVDTAVFSYQVGCMKPDPAIYFLACRRLGVAPSDTIFIGDGATLELQGADAAGLRPYRAAWFLDRWRQFANRFPVLYSPEEVVGLVER